MSRCLSCEQRQLACDGLAQCSPCMKARRRACTYPDLPVATVDTALCRSSEAPANDGEGRMGTAGVSSNACLACREAGVSCELTAGDVPCLRCVQISNEHCINITGEGSREAIQTCHYGIHVDDEGRAAVVPIPRFEVDRGERYQTQFDTRTSADSKAKCSTPGCRRTRQYGPLCTTCRRREYEARRNNPDQPKCIRPRCNRPRSLARHQLCYPCYFERHHQKQNDVSGTTEFVCSKAGCARSRLKGKTMCPDCHTSAARENPKCSNEGCDRSRPATGRLTVCAYCRNKAVRGRSCASQDCPNAAPKNGLGGIFCVDCALEHGMLIEKQGAQADTRPDQAYEQAPWWRKELERRRKKTVEVEPDINHGSFGYLQPCKPVNRSEKRQKRVRNDAPCLACRCAKRKCEIPLGTEVCTRCARQSIECRPYGEVQKVVTPETYEAGSDNRRVRTTENSAASTPEVEYTAVGTSSRRGAGATASSTRASSSGIVDDRESVNDSLGMDEDSDAGTPNTSTSLINPVLQYAPAIRRTITPSLIEPSLLVTSDLDQHRMHPDQTAAPKRPRLMDFAHHTLESTSAARFVETVTAQSVHEKLKLSFLINV